MPRLESCYFAGPVGRDEGPWRRFAFVLEHSAAEHCASWERSIVEIEKSDRRGQTNIPAHVHNTRKLEHWNRVVWQAPDGTEMLLVDADVVILRPLDDVWERPFDLAYTVKDQPFPFNLGVMFVRISDRVRAFFQAWHDANADLFTNPGDHLSWRAKYGGVNQASFGRLLDAGVPASLGLALERLPCAEWNCEESAWKQFDRSVARILHVKGMLRETVLQRAAVTVHMRPLIDLWRATEKAAFHQRKERAS